MSAVAALRIRVDREPVPLPTIDELASRRALSAYDAAYLELALRRRVPLATRDEALCATMPNAGVPAYTPV